MLKKNLYTPNLIVLENQISVHEPSNDDIVQAPESHVPESHVPESINDGVLTLARLLARIAVDKHLAEKQEENL
jgi:hypothetical protein